MKKLFFLAAIAAATLSACSSEDAILDTPQEEELGTPVAFSAYTARATRASVITETQLSGLGFGVYAFEQNTTPWNTYRASNTVPNFFYNQKVACKVNNWTFPANLTNDEYAALETADATNAPKYYSSTADAHTLKNDVITTFAATQTPALYDALPAAIQALGTANYAADSWDYEPHKYFSNNEGALHSFFAYAPYNKNVTAVFSRALTGPAIRYNAADDYDLLYATPAAAGGGTGQVANSVNKLVDVEKADVTGVIGMNFQHALAKVSFDVSYFNDDVHSNHDEGEDFLDENTTITVRSVKFVGNVPSQGLLNLYDGSWTYETTEESAYEVVGPIDFTWDGTDDAANDPKDLKTDMMVIPTMSTDDVKIQIVYDVTTIDPTDPKNNSTVTNTVTSDNAYPLVKGTAYTFHLHLGITSVKFGAEVTDWGTDTEHNVDLPNNH